LAEGRTDRALCSASVSLFRSGTRSSTSALLSAPGSSGKLGSGESANGSSISMGACGAVASDAIVRMLASECERLATSSGPISSRSYEGSGSAASIGCAIVCSEASSTSS
jgi:hypothetical protein